MKKMCLLFTLVITMLLSLFLAGCKNHTKQELVDLQEDVNPTPRIIYSSSDWVYYETLCDLVENSDYIIIGEVVEALPVERWNEDSERDYGWTNISPFRVKVIEAISGDIKEGEILDIRMCGGLFEGISENNKFEIIDVIEDGIDGKYLKENHKYLLFAKGENYTELNIRYPYYLATPWFGMTEIIDGKLQTDKRNGFFEFGTSIEETRDMILESVGVKAVNET